MKLISNCSTIDQKLHVLHVHANANTETSKLNIEINTERTSKANAKDAPLACWARAAPLCSGDTERVPLPLAVGAPDAPDEAAAVAAAEPDAETAVESVDESVTEGPA